MAFKVYISEDIPDAGKAYLRERGYDVVVGADSRRETIMDGMRNADAVLMRTAEFDREMFEQAPKLKVIAKNGVGTDNVDLAACENLGIWVVNGPYSNAVSVAEHVMGGLLYLVKNYTTVDKFIRDGEFNRRTSIESMELDGKTLGIVGVGRIGSLVAKKMHFGLGLNIIGYDPYIDASKQPDYIEMVSSLEELFDRADVVTVHTPSTPETVGMIDEKLLRRLKPSGIVINCARGGIVNERDLAKVLSERAIRAAFVDVFRPEPIEPSNPLIQCDNILLTPHYAAISVEAGMRSGVHAAMGIDEVLSGKKPQWPVNQPKNPRNGA